MRNSRGRTDGEDRYSPNVWWNGKRLFRASEAKCDAPMRVTSNGHAESIVELPSGR
jgi:hypothetical protein